MLNTTLLHQLITASAERAPDAPALTAGKTSLSYRELDDQVASIAAGLVGLGLATPLRAQAPPPTASRGWAFLPEHFLRGYDPITVFFPSSAFGVSIFTPPIVPFRVCCAVNLVWKPYLCRKENSNCFSSKDSGVNKSRSTLTRWPK